MSCENTSCFFCRYFVHLNPDEDYCQLQDKIVTTFTPVCPCFKSDEVIVDE